MTTIEFLVLLYTAIIMALVLACLNAIRVAKRLETDNKELRSSKEILRHALLYIADEHQRQLDDPAEALYGRRRGDKPCIYNKKEDE